MKVLLFFVALIGVVSCNGSGGAGSSSGQSAEDTTPYQSKLTIKTDGYANQDITSMKMIVYKVYAGSNEDCSDLSLIKEFNSPVEVEIVGGYSFGDINIPDGTYNCVAVEFDRTIKFTTDSLPAGSGTDCVIGENTTVLTDTSVYQGTVLTPNSAMDDLDYFTSGYYTDVGAGYAKIYGRDLIYHADGSGHGYSEAVVNLGSFVDKRANDTPLGRATLYLSTKVGARHPDYKFIPPYAAEWATDGATYTGANTRLFDHGGQEVSNLINQPIDIDGNNNLEFIVAFGASTDVIDNDDSIQCALKNINFDLQQVD